MWNNIFTLQGFFISCWISLICCTFGTIYLTYNETRATRYADLLRRFWLIGEVGAYFEEICPVIAKKFMGGVLICFGIMVIYWPLFLANVNSEIDVYPTVTYIALNLIFMTALILVGVFWVKSNYKKIMDLTKFIPDLFLILDTPTKYSRNIILVIALAHVLAAAKFAHLF